jgi:hypothetical protein
MARRVKRAKFFSFDQLADWTPFAAQSGPVNTHLGWVLHGTATLNGVEGALAISAGWYGIGVGRAPIDDLGLWERLDVIHGIKFKTAPECEDAPRFPPTVAPGNSKHIDREEYWKPAPLGEASRND